ncbi:hypothetical protein DIPPA_33103 [Diplonema papillatum]|nr:hypothetical protein DIPPA_33103 [Diplonema papillatum]
MKAEGGNAVSLDEPREGTVRLSPPTWYGKNVRPVDDIEADRVGTAGLHKCAACGEYKSPSCFSDRQLWWRPKQESKCKECTVAYVPESVVEFE